MCLLAINISSYVKCLVLVFCALLNWVVCLFSVEFKFSFECNVLLYLQLPTAHIKLDVLMLSLTEHLKSNFSTFRACNSHMATLLVSTGLHPARLSLSVGCCHLPSRPCDYAQGTWPGSSEYSCSAWTSQQVSFSDQALYYSLCLACQAALSPYRLSDLPGPNLALSPCLGVD